MSVNQHKEMGNSRSNNGGEYAKKGAPKTRSPVWNHFTLNKLKRAICNHCKEDLQGDSKQGTNHLRRHLKNKHPDEYAKTDFQSSIKKITDEDTTAFGREELVLSVERNIECVALRSTDKKHAALTGEEREDVHLAEKRARLNKEKQLKRPINASGLNAGAILIGEENNTTVQLPVQLGLQNRNYSTLELGGVFKSFVTEYQQLIEQKQQQQEAEIKELKEALEHAKAEIRKEKEARVAAEQKVRSLMEKRNALQNEKLSSEDEVKWLDDKKWMAKMPQLRVKILDAKACKFLPLQEVKYLKMHFASLEGLCYLDNLKFGNLRKLEYLDMRICWGESDGRMMTSAHVQESFSRTLFDDSFGTVMTATDGIDRNNHPLLERCPSPIESWNEFSPMDLRWPSSINEWNEYSSMHLNLRWPSPIDWNKYPLIDQDYDIDKNEEMF